MDNEPYRVLGHHAAADAIADILGEQNAKAWREFKLPSGKIADVFAVRDSGTIEIYEVKTVLAAKYFDECSEKYGHWCNNLWLCVPHITLTDVNTHDITRAWRRNRDTVGLIGVYAEALAIYRQPVHVAMTPELRNVLLRNMPKPWSAGETGGKGPLVTP